MLNKKSLRFILSLIFLATLLWSCSATTYSNCPIYPIGGQKVAEELQNVPYQGYENFWHWVARLDKLRQELELCKSLHH